MGRDRETLEGWILDVKGTSSGVDIWVKCRGGEIRLLSRPVSPSFFVSGKGVRYLRLAEHMERRGALASLEEVTDFSSGQTVKALRVTAPSPAAFSFLRNAAGRCGGERNLYSCDIPVEQVFFAEVDAFPLCRCFLEVDRKGAVRTIVPLEDVWDREYAIPPLSTMYVKPIPPRGHNPFHAPWASLEISWEDETFEVEWDRDDSFLGNVNSLVRRFDPDLIISEWGDEYIFPRLFDLSRRRGVPLAFSRSFRDVKGVSPARKGRSFFSYGQILYRAPSVSFPGRIHIDGRNSFFYREVGFAGIAELARISRMPLGRVSRASPGTLISAMEMEYAWKAKMLIPFKKRQSESFKSAGELVVADKGGLVYMPPPGTLERVCELDYASMYPTLMVKYNISPETLMCGCCRDHKVPETGTHTCRRRKGLIPSVLDPVVARRKWYKALRMESTGEMRALFESRQKALKWILVVSFGFLGYRNARFGKIEAHEAVTAYGREMLLRAKDIAEGEGYAFLHGLTDALWVRKEGASDEDYRKLAEEISAGTGMEIAVEGIYRWISFLPSRTRKGLSVPGRFVGCFEGGEMKSRGTLLRRRDTPSFVRRMQEKMLEAVSTFSTLKELRRNRNILEEIHRSFSQDLESGRVGVEELSIYRRLSRPVAAYDRNTMTAQVVRELLGRGVDVRPGDRISYVVTGSGKEGGDERARSLGYFDGGSSPDLEWYSRLLNEAAQELFYILDED